MSTNKLIVQIIIRKYQLIELRRLDTVNP